MSGRERTNPQTSGELFTLTREEYMRQRAKDDQVHVVVRDTRRRFGGSEV